MFFQYRTRSHEPNGRPVNTDYPSVVWPRQGPACFLPINARRFADQLRHAAVDNDLPLRFAMLELGL
jgi:hypothetical protein